MVLDAVSNFVRGNTDAAVGTSDTTVSVVDASIFPDPPTDGEFNVVIWDVANFPRPDQDGDVEIMRVTERDTTADELTVTRAQEMTSASAHPEGSAIHLSPTAKIFTDIEDTFTTEAEAADAAPVQSVFGRVGDVVAETGDYAATQISNFSSEVLTSISCSTIAPSEITDLWNGTVVTSDVNNTNTTTETLDADAIRTNITGATISPSEGQTVPDDTLTEIEFSEATERNPDVDTFADLDNNALVIPSGDYSFARLSFGLRASTDVEFDIMLLSEVPNNAGERTEFAGNLWRTYVQKTDWFPVSQGDSFSSQFRQISESDVDIQPGRTFLSIEVV